MKFEEYITKSLSEKTIVNKADTKRMLDLIKDYGKVIYKKKEYNVKVTTTGKFIKGNGFSIESDKIKSYTIDSKLKAVVLNI